MSTDLHDEIRRRIKRRQGKGRVVGDLLEDTNYKHVGFANLGAAYDEVLADLDAEPTVSGIYLDKHAHQSDLAEAASRWLTDHHAPVVVSGALRWTQPDYSPPMVDTGSTTWRGAWQRIPWHDGKRPARVAPRVDAATYEALLRSAPVVSAGGAAWTRAGWVSSRGVHGDYYCTEDVRDVLVDDPEATLWELFRDFPLVDDDHRRRVLSMLLTAVCLPAINGPVPAYLVSAHNPGDGKTLLARVVSMVADGREVVVPWHDDEDRTRELLLSALDSPARVVILDNVRGKLGGSILETILTATTVVGSRKYEKAREYRVNKLIVVTGNDPRVTPDMARRVVRVQVDRGGQLPPADLPDVLEIARIRRPEMLSAVRAIIDRWDRVPAPIHGCRSYESWAGLIGGVLGCDWRPIDAARVAAEHDPEALVWGPILEVMHARLGDTAHQVREIIAAVGRSTFDAVIRGQHGTPEAQIGAGLSGLVGRACGGWRVVREEIDVYAVDRWVKRNAYRVESVEAVGVEDAPF